MACESSPSPCMVLQAVSNSGVSSENSLAYKHLFQLRVMILPLIVDMIRRTAAICARRVTDARPGFRQTPDAVGLLDIALEFVLRPRLPAPVRADAGIRYVRNTSAGRCCRVNPL
jgi:hypothetical protein